MKTFLFTFIAFVTLAAAAPVAQAGQFARVYNGRGVVYVHKSQLYSPYYASNYYGHRKHHRSHRAYVYSDYYRPSYRTSYYRPYPVYRTNYYHSSCGYPARPRVAISFGF
jgi:hypothetical protein